MFHKAKETAEEEVVPSEIEKEEKQVEERLQVLNAKKHNLVQVLKLVSVAVSIYTLCFIEILFMSIIDLIGCC